MAWGKGYRIVCWSSLGSGRIILSQRDKEYAEGDYEEACKSWNTSMFSAKIILDKGLCEDNEEQLRKVCGTQLRLNLSMAHAI